MLCHCNNADSNKLNDIFGYSFVLWLYLYSTAHGRSTVQGCQSGEWVLFQVVLHLFGKVKHKVLPHICVALEAHGASQNSVSALHKLYNAFTGVGLIR